MVRVRSATALQALSASVSCALGVGVAACGNMASPATADNAGAVSTTAEAALSAFRKKVGFAALHTGPRKLPMVFRLGEDVPENWLPVIQEVFDSWESSVGKDLFAFTAGTLSGRTNVRVKTALETLPVPFEDGFWSIVASKKTLCQKKTGDTPAACARYSPSRNSSGIVTDWHPVEQDILFDVGSYDFRIAQPVEAPPGSATDPDASGQAGANAPTDPTKLALSLRQVLSHELGHVLGLPHADPSDGESIMWPASLATKGVYTVAGPVTPKTFDYERLEKLVGAWNASAAK